MSTALNTRATAKLSRALDLPFLVCGSSSWCSLDLSCNHPRRVGVGRCSLGCQPTKWIPCSEGRVSDVNSPPHHLRRIDPSYFVSGGNASGSPSETRGKCPGDGPCGECANYFIMARFVEAQVLVLKLEVRSTKAPRHHGRMLFERKPCASSLWKICLHLFEGTKKSAGGIERGSLHAGGSWPQPAS